MNSAAKGVVFALLICLFLGFHLYWLHGLTDDSYIFFRFSRNLAQGHGLRWNLDEPPVEGYTSFLWVMAGSLLFVIFPANLPRSMSWLSILFFVASLLVFTKMMNRQAQDRKYTWRWFALLFAASGPLIFWATSGMETSLFLLLILACFYYLELYLQTQNKKYYFLIWGLSFLCFLARPDGFLLAFVLGFYFLIFKKGFVRKDLLLPFIFFFLMPFVLYNIWRTAYFHSLFPNTFYAKATGSFNIQAVKGLLYLKDFALTYLLPLLPLLVILLFKQKKFPLRFKPYSGLVLAFILLYSIFILLVGGDYMAMYRFFVPLLPLIYLLLGRLLFTVASVSTSKTAAAWTAFAFAVIVTFLPSTPLEKAIWGGNKTHHYGCYEGLKTERWYVNRYITIGKLFGRLKHRPSDTLVVSAIGAVGYFSRMNVLDYYGLTDTHIARRRQKDFAWHFPGHEKTDIDYILSKKPTYLMAYKHFTRRPVALDHEQFQEFYIRGDPRREEFLRQNYMVRNIRVEDRLNNESGYLAFLAIKR